MGRTRRIVEAAEGEGRRQHETTTRGRQYATGDITEYKEK
jgi:hypothetical protein